jgi:hypothetical protein
MGLKIKNQKIMRIRFNNSIQATSILFLAILLTTTSCKKEEDLAPVVAETAAAAAAAIEVADLTSLILGGPFVLRRDLGDVSPLLASLWLCGLPSNGAGNADASDWTNPDGTWDYTRKPQVDGDVTWISDFTVTLDGNGNRIITGNALPDHPTGVFPIDSASVAFQYDRNPNIITNHTVSYTFPAIPQIASTPDCVTFGPSGIALSGSAIYHGASTLGNDAAAHEMLDRFGGHTDGTERYHYHYIAEDLENHIDPPTAGHSGLMGYMMDGFGIYGPRGEDGEILTSADLDECHGHTHSVLWDGEMIEIYHYHWSYDFPYTIGAFKGTRLY